VRLREKSVGTADKRKAWRRTRVKFRTIPPPWTRRTVQSDRAPARLEEASDGDGAAARGTPLLETLEHGCHTVDRLPAAVVGGGVVPVNAAVGGGGGGGRRRSSRGHPFTAGAARPHLLPRHSSNSQSVAPPSLAAPFKARGRYPCCPAPTPQSQSVLYRGDPRSCRQTRALATCARPRGKEEGRGTFRRSVLSFSPPPASQQNAAAPKVQQVDELGRSCRRPRLGRLGRLLGPRRKARRGGRAALQPGDPRRVPHVSERRRRGYQRNETIRGRRLLSGSDRLAHAPLFPLPRCRSLFAAIVALTALFRSRFFALHVPAAYSYAGKGFGELEKGGKRGKGAVDGASVRDRDRSPV
jgi:hypothetical protein